MTIEAQLVRRFRRHVDAHFYDDSGACPRGTAIYALSDPRDIRETRYIGQTGNPRRRFLQHLNAARLWLPDEIPWWIQSPKLRPLYQWVRELHREGERLPVMLVLEWAQTPEEGRIAERRTIFECLAKGLDLFNVETEILGRQLPLV